MTTKVWIGSISGANVDEDVVVLLSAVAATIKDIDVLSTGVRTTKTVLDLMEDMVNLPIDLRPDVHEVKIRSLCHWVRVMAEK